MRISDWSSDVCSSDLWFKRGPAIPDRWFPRDEIDSDSDALDVLHGTKDRTRRSLIGADAWFDRREAERYEVYEQNVRMSTGDALSLVVIKSSGMVDKADTRSIRITMLKTKNTQLKPK